MITIGEDPIVEIFICEMGVKTVCVESQLIQERPGGYFYLELSKEEVSTDG